MKTTKANLIVLGAGGFAQQLILIIARCGQYRIVGFVDETINEDTYLQSIRVRRSLSAFKNINIDNTVLISGVGDIATRRRWYEQCYSRFNFATIIDPSVIPAPDTNVADDVIILANAVCSSGCVIGKGNHVD